MNNALNPLMFESMSRLMSELERLRLQTILNYPEAGKFAFDTEDGVILRLIQ